MGAPEESTKAPPPAEPEAPRPEPETAPAAPSVEPEEDWSVRYRYLLAEFDNYRKRVDREQANLRRDSRALVLRELLPLHDAFDRAEEAARQRPADDPLRRGMELLVREWERFLATERVQPVAREGEPFRPEEQEAVGELPADATHPAGSVAQIVQQGFRTSGGLLRAAKVMIAQRRAPPSTDNSKPTPNVGEDGPASPEP